MIDHLNWLREQADEADAAFSLALLKKFGTHVNKMRYKTTFYDGELKMLAKVRSEATKTWTIVAYANGYK
jgi:hypothetical protein